MCSMRFCVDMLDFQTVLFQENVQLYSRVEWEVFQNLGTDLSLNPS